MKLSAPIYKLKRRARLVAREQAIPLHAALDRVAATEGFQSWSHLASSAPENPTDRILAELSAGDLLLLGARPGHGKTLLALELAIAASKAGLRSFFFTLDYTESDVVESLGSLRVDPKAVPESFALDTSDEICADHIVRRLGEGSGEAFVVIDYLQLLDQKRKHAALDTQIRTLKAFAQSSGAIIVAISQIDRAFDPQAKRLPDLSDVRLPNPLDLALFTKTCFLHEGEIQLQSVA